MELRVDRLLKKLRHNEQEILALIDADPLLTKRYCRESKVYIANASKALFTPVKEHQLYAKGIIYRKTEILDGVWFELVSLPLIKIYNYGEDARIKHLASQMRKAKAKAVFTEKLDGTMISRCVIKGKVMFSTRGILATMPSDDEESRKFFDWTLDLVARKYPKLADPKFFPNTTMVFELVGPLNRIVTFYPEWDLVLTSILDFHDWAYLEHDVLVSMAQGFGLNVSAAFSPSGDTLDEQVENAKRLFHDTDEEGVVIQFEDNHRVIARIKAKSETYRQLFKLNTNCSYKRVVEMTESSGFKTWTDFKTHLESFGNNQHPEELMGDYEMYFNQYLEHLMYLTKIAQWLNDEATCLIAAFEEHFGITDDKEKRKAFADVAKTTNRASLMFRAYDGTLTVDFLKGFFKTPEESKAFYATLL